MPNENAEFHLTTNTIGQNEKLNHDGWGCKLCWSVYSVFNLVLSGSEVNYFSEFLVINKMSISSDSEEFYDAEDITPSRTSR